MGECGCSHGSYDYTLPGPKGKVYGIQFYPGCDYCDAPAGVGIDLLDDDDMSLEGAGPPLIREGQTMAGVPVIGGGELLKALRRLGCVEIDGFPLDDDSFGHHDQYEVITVASCATHKRFNDALLEEASDG